MNQINPRKLLNSKWTAINPDGKEKHFLVTEVEYDEEDRVVHCLILAVLSKRETSIDWRKLKDAAQWTHGWK